MNVGVTIHARAPEHAVALIHRDCVVIVKRCGMSRRDVAALTEHRHPDDQHPVVGRAMGIVARRAVLTDRCVLPEYGATHLGVTADTEFRD